MRLLPAVMSLLVLLAAAPAPAAPARALELRADEVTVRDAGRLIEARGNVRITDGRSRIRADRALYAVGDRRIVLTGSVVVTIEAGTLSSQRAAVTLTPDRQIEAVEAAGGVELKSGQRVLKASQVTYTVGTETLSASGDVSLFIPPDLTATGQELTARATTATLSGGAKVQNKDGSIQGDQVEVLEREQVAHVRGHVVSVYQDTRITAGSATVLGRERKAVFRDRVTLTRPGRTMQAQLVTVYYQDRRIVAEGETTIRFEEEPPRP